MQGGGVGDDGRFTSTSLYCCLYDLLLEFVNIDLA
jgi:hypothetical protein